MRHFIGEAKSGYYACVGSCTATREVIVTPSLEIESHRVGNCLRTINKVVRVGQIELTVLDIVCRIDKDARLDTLAKRIERDLEERHFCVVFEDELERC